MLKWRLVAATSVYIFAFSCHVTADDQATGIRCPGDWINCGNGKCVHSLWRCDGDDDCGNLRDEENCEVAKPSNRCESSQFQCLAGGYCIPRTWRCDLEHDCDDGSDESDCHTPPECGGFRCKDHHCIPKIWRCDGQIDCPDLSDEQECIKAVTAPRISITSTSSQLPFTVLRSNFASSTVTAPRISITSTLSQLPFTVLRSNFASSTEKTTAAENPKKSDEDFKATLAEGNKNKNEDSTYGCSGDRAALAAIVSFLTLIALVGMMIYFRQFLVRNIVKEQSTNPATNRNVEENISMEAACSSS